MKNFWLPEHNKLILILFASFIPVILLLAWPSANNNQNNMPMPNTMEMDFVYIAPGTFMMGSPEDEIGRDIDEHQHPVNLSKGFYIQSKEITQKQWESVMGHNPSIFTDCGPDCPVENVSGHDVQEFIKHLNKRESEKKYRLPTEAEWEFACRAGTIDAFHFDGCLTTVQANYNGYYPVTGCPRGQNRQSPLPVGSLAPNPWGIYDMSGNVWEWCQDFYGDYEPEIAVTDPKGPVNGSYMVIRGGSWKHEARKCRSACRGKFSPAHKNSTIGFRLVLIKD